MPPLILTAHYGHLMALDDLNHFLHHLVCNTSLINDAEVTGVMNCFL